MNDLALGFICVVITAIGHGSNYVVVRNLDIQDGFFVYWVQSVSIFTEGFIVAIITEFFTGFFPAFSWYGFLGGVIWSSATMVVVPCINEIGIGIGYLLISTIEILIGWVSARYGWFGLEPQRSGNEKIEIVGVIITVLSGFMFALVRSTGNSNNGVDEFSNLLPNGDVRDGLSKKTLSTPQQNETEPEEGCCLTQQLVSHLTKEKLLYKAITATVFVGVMYGLQMMPVTYAITMLPEEETHTSGIFYAFSYFTGVLVTSTFWFLIYAVVYKRNEPFINAKSMVPALLNGIVWSIGTTAWLVSNEKLSQSISYPLSARLFGVVGVLWGALYFREIKGTRNIVILVIALITAGVGVFLVGLAKVMGN